MPPRATAPFSRSGAYHEKKEQEESLPAGSARGSCGCRRNRLGQPRALGVLSAKGSRAGQRAAVRNDDGPTEGVGRLAPTARRPDGGHGEYGAVLGGAVRPVGRAGAGSAAGRCATAQASTGTLQDRQPGLPMDPEIAQLRAAERVLSPHRPDPGITHDRSGAQ